MGEPLFSVIVPTYGRAEQLAEALESVLAQDCPDFECIVVDDGGGVPDIPDDARLRLFSHDTNMGPPAALNTGIAAARGRYVTFLDDDDVLTPDRLSMAVDRLDTADVILCLIEQLRGIPRPEWNRQLEGNVHDVILDTWAPHRGTAVMRRDAVLQFDPRYLASQDLEWWIRVSRSLRFTTVPRVGYQLRLHRSARNLNGPLARIRYGKLMIEEHYDDYFSTHPRAEAFRWFSMGLIARQLGDHRFARHAFLRSLRLDPLLRRFGHLGLSFKRSTFDVDEHLG